ncbi:MULTISPECIES: hypothetical protein [unclassified Microcoleus]
MSGFGDVPSMLEVFPRRLPTLVVAEWQCGQRTRDFPLGNIVEVPHFP